MNKEIQVLNTIFELELKPPFKLGPYLDQNPGFVLVKNKHSEVVGFYYEIGFRFQVSVQKGNSCLDKIKRTFNVDFFSENDVYHIAKHLYNWVQGKFSEEINEVIIRDSDVFEYIKYKKL